jgi:hypothetical protein
MSNTANERKKTMSIGRIFTRDLLTAVSYCDMTPLQRFCHNVRLTVSTWDDKTRRFTGRDRREHNVSNRDGQLISNRFTMGTALVASQDGTVFGAVTARSAQRAAAAMALRAARNGNIVSNWNVEKINKSGATHSETFFFGADSPDGGKLDSRDDENGLSVIELTASEIALLDTYGIDSSDMDGWQDRNWDARMERLS